MPPAADDREDCPMATNEMNGAPESELRVELAAAFRAAYHYGWNRGINNHMTARLQDGSGHFLMNPRGIGWHEITAAHLLKLDRDGKILSNTDLRPGPAGLNFHSAILREKPAVNCTIHIHPMQGVIVSALEGGLRFYDQESCALYGEVSYHPFEGIAEEADEAPRIITELGDKYTMIMENHGLLSVGRTIGEAFTYMDKLLRACETQVRILSTGVPARQVSKQICEFTRSQLAKRQGNRPAGELEWKMHMRKMQQLDPSFTEGA
jgi:ribulose-5-phosphate 4-epimerase/fuculose-1-phosphate aldolase